MRRVLFVSLLITLFSAGLYVVGVRVAPFLPPAIEVESDDDLPSGIRLSGSPSSQTLTLDDQVVLERSGSHFGTPRISPDGALVAITVVPTGTETFGLAEIYVIERATGRVRDRIPGHNPRWQTGRSNRLRFDQVEANNIRPGLYDASNGSILREDTLLPDDNPSEAVPQEVELSELTYPDTIRVAHHPENNCRNVPDWQVDVIPFEEYVARSVPAEIPISWSPEALAAQSVATRTYAWHQILRRRRYYDVTDWANFQMMCNGRYASTDAAVNRTAGQYLAYVKDRARAPIIAMYSAKNSHPTLTNPAAPYLRSIPDETGLGEARWGHGYGLSQWGAARRAKAGQTYLQILGHYYTDVTLQNARQPSQVVGGFVGLPMIRYLPVGGLRWDALVPAESPPGAVNLDPGPDSLPIRGVWLRSPDLASGGTLTATLSIDGQLQENVSLQIDWDPPAPPTFNAPAAVEIQRATIFIATAEQDARIGLSNNWLWQGESLYHTTGESVDDVAADGGQAKEAKADDHRPGWWYGPYTTEIPHNATYRALFRMRMGQPTDNGSDNALPHRPIAQLDVTDRAGTLRLGLREIWPSDFTGVGQYVDIPVDFHLFKPVQGLEFRVKWHGEVDLALDRIQLWQLQNISRGRIDWPLSHSGLSTVSAIAFDSARNASPVVTRQIEFGSEQPPQFGELENLHSWWTRLPVVISVPVQDYNSGLDRDSGRMLLNDQPQAAHFSQPNEPLAAQKLSAVLTELDDGAYTVRFQANDRAGLQGESEAGQLRIDRTPPVVQAEVVPETEEPAPPPDEQNPASTPTPTSASRLLFNGPVRIAIEAEDATSGVWGIAYVLNDGPVALYSEPFRIDEDGIHLIRYWAKDKAGNYTSSHRMRIWVRNVRSLGLSEDALRAGTQGAE